MKPIISAREVQDLLRNGGDINSLPSDAIFTPSARDLLRDFENNGAHGNSAPPPAKSVNPSSSRGDLESCLK